jgi:hypothetical protein
MFRQVGWLLAAGFLVSPCLAADGPSDAEVRAGLRKAVDFFTTNCARHDGYVWRYSRDLKLSEGEAETDDSVIWVQPPGTPAVGLALLDAYESTGEKHYLNLAQKTGHALVRGQLQSGGWFYSIEFDPKARVGFGYRDNKAFRPSTSRKNRTNITTLDDNTTQSAIQFLARLDRALDFKDEQIHESVQFALEALLAAQYPNGGWYQNWDKYPTKPDREKYPVLRASYPETWSRQWLNDWPGRYYTNDNVAGTLIATFLDVAKIYDDKRYLEAARRTGDFLLLAQMPDPQPAWAQQYDEKMQPVWDRKFEPPAVSGLESQYVIDSLLLLYRRTRDEKYLEPIPRALDYLRKSRLPDGRLARFYELKTNRPLYFKVTGNRYDLTYDAGDLPTHYGFIVASQLDRLTAEYEKLRKEGPKEQTASTRSTPSSQQVRVILDALDERGSWIDRRSMKGFRKASPEGVIESATFINNVQTLCAYLRAGSR